MSKDTAMVNILVLLSSIIALCGAAQFTVDLPVYKDAFVYFSDLGCPPSNCYKANQNFGNGSTLHLASYHISTQGVIGFNIANISIWDSQTSIVSAILYLPPLTLNSIAYVDSQCTITVRALANTWREYTVTANTLPAINSTFTYTVTDSAFASPNSVSVDVTDYVTSVVGGVQTKMSFILSSPTNCAIPSREAGTSPGTFVRLVFNKVDNTSDCNTGWALCNNTCFDPTLYDCVSTTPDNGQTLCPKGLGFCNGGCYNKETHTCIADRICPAGYGLCNSDCYDMNAYDCFSGMLCRKPNQRCGNACFDPAGYTCVGGVLQQTHT